MSVDAYEVYRYTSEAGPGAPAEHLYDSGRAYRRVVVDGDDHAGSEVRYYSGVPSSVSEGGTGSDTGERCEYDVSSSE